MTNAKWLALVAAFGLALTMVACGDDDEPTTCSADEDCADDETCDTSCGFCAKIDGQCASDAQCAEGETCQPLAEGCAARFCKPGEGPTPTACTDETFNVCYDQDQWCDSDSTGAGTCANLDVGSCGGASGKELPAANGPMIYYVEQIGECTADDATHCNPPGTSCKFGVYFWDPQGDMDGEYGDVKYITATGTVTGVGFVDSATIDGNFGAVPVYTCVGTSPEALLVMDNAGNQSNAVCLAGR